MTVEPYHVLNRYASTIVSIPRGKRDIIQDDGFMRTTESAATQGTSPDRLGVFSPGLHRLSWLSSQARYHAIAGSGSVAVGIGAVEPWMPSI